MVIHSVLCFWKAIGLYSKTEYRSVWVFDFIGFGLKLFNGWNCAQDIGTGFRVSVCVVYSDN